MIKKRISSEAIGVKTIFRLMLVVILFAQCNAAKHHSLKDESIQLAALMCEDKIAPSGVPLEDFYFRWELSSNERGQYQQAYQIIVASSAALLAAQKNLIWNSGVVKSSNSVHIPYQGEKLKPGNKYFWSVKVWDKNNRPSAWSNVARFTTGIFDVAEWSNAKWISYEELPDSLIVSPGVEAFSKLATSVCNAR